MVSKKKVEKEKAIVRKPPVCPHCSKEIERIEWRPFAEGAYMLVCHADCMKVIGVK